MGARISAAPISPSGIKSRNQRGHYIVRLQADSSFAVESPARRARIHAQVSRRKRQIFAETLGMIQELSGSRRSRRETLVNPDS